mgnify:CR=1 FL=1
MRFRTSGELFTGIDFYFVKGSVDEFIITLSVLATKYDSILERDKKSGNALDERVAKILIASIKKRLKKTKKIKINKIKSCLFL